VNSSGTPKPASGADGAGRRGVVTIRFKAKPVEIMRLEAGVRALPFLADEERNRLLIVASEIFDNIITYSSRLRCRSVTLRVSKGEALTLTFFFKSSNFSFFAANEKDSEHRYFDKAVTRYRGLGLTMCRNLSRSMRFRPGVFSDSVIISF
jgi:hypothetical protein